MMKPITLLAVLALATPLHAQTVAPPAAPAAAETPMSDAVVRRIDAAAGKITLKHGPIANLDMPPMTMVFRVQPPELLHKVKVGDSVKFHAVDIGGTYTVTAIEAAQ
ncbi:copper-binding protein [Betaproteobacteria bacterium SCN2]|jgi:Cu/Ag efflux protein CusF|nr:copper-binding protein [Betaproteobacteria bacterium SCN2]